MYSSIVASYGVAFGYSWRGKELHELLLTYFSG